MLYSLVCLFLLGFSSLLWFCSTTSRSGRVAVAIPEPGTERKGAASKGVKRSKQTSNLVFFRRFIGSFTCCGWLLVVCFWLLVVVF